MNIPLVQNSSTEVGVLENCGHLFPVRFCFNKKVLEPMNIAPWVHEELDPSTSPMLKNLRGDFFCAPFGASDLMADETRPHGSSANDKWDIINIEEDSIKLKLSKNILGAELIKEIKIAKDETVIYQKHTFTGGRGIIPIGHHAMLRIPTNAYISFSEFEFGGTPPLPIENDITLGRSILKYPQQFSDLTKVRKYDDELINVSKYPFEKNHEDLFMVISKRNADLGWSAVSCPEQGWLWFSIKNIKTLPNTVVWLSNGGRYYKPFSSRHINVIGIEETNSFFHLGHKASTENNFLNEAGYSTYIELDHSSDTVIPYLFGAAQIPKTFGKVKSIEENNNGILFIDEFQNKIHSKINLNHLRN
ncbi:MAG: hypothetical protein HXY50_14635 [Ignavibacteriaceae bacterium]|nr:hypothetical protein [Ignavibacteriaceae bacterium]